MKDRQSSTVGTKYNQVIVWRGLGSPKGKLVIYEEREERRDAMAASRFMDSPQSGVYDHLYERLFPRTKGGRDGNSGEEERRR